MSATSTLSPPSARRLTTEDVAALFGYAQTSTVLRRVREDDLPAIRFNRRYYFNEADVRAWMAERGLIEATTPDADAAAQVDPEWVAAQVAKFSADDLRRAGELLLALSRADRQGSVA